MRRHLRTLRKIMFPQPKPGPELTPDDELRLLLFLAVMSAWGFLGNLLYAAGILVYSNGQLVWRLPW